MDLTHTNTHPSARLLVGGEFDSCSLQCGPWLVGRWALHGCVRVWVSVCECVSVCVCVCGCSESGTTHRDLGAAALMSSGGRCVPFDGGLKIGMGVVVCVCVCVGL